MKRTFAWVMAMLFAVTGYGWLRCAEGGELEKGKALYEDRCLLCHGPKGDGKGPGSIALDPKPANYTKKSFWEDPNIQQKIPETIKVGKGQMRPSPDLKDEDIQAIILYMTTTFKPK